MPFTVRACATPEVERTRSRIVEQPDRRQALSLSGAAAGSVDRDDKITGSRDDRRNSPCDEGGSDNAKAGKHGLALIVAERNGRDLLLRIALHSHDDVLNKAAVLEKGDLAAEDVLRSASREPRERESDGLVEAVAGEEKVRRPARNRRIRRRRHEREAQHRQSQERSQLTCHGILPFAAAVIGHRCIVQSFFNSVNEKPLSCKGSDKVSPLLRGRVEM
jgi:hypothetical protein